MDHFNYFFPLLNSKTTLRLRVILSDSKWLTSRLGSLFSLLGRVIPGILMGANCCCLFVTLGRLVWNIFEVVQFLHVQMNNCFWVQVGWWFLNPGHGPVFGGLSSVSLCSSLQGSLVLETIHHTSQMGHRREAISLQPTSYYYQVWAWVEVSERKTLVLLILHGLNSALPYLISIIYPKTPLTFCTAVFFLYSSFLYPMLCVLLMYLLL